MPVPIVWTLQVTVASGCNFFVNEAKPQDDIRASQLSAAEFALSISCIHDRVDLSHDKGTAHDSFNFAR